LKSFVSVLLVYRKLMHSNALNKNVTQMKLLVLQNYKNAEALRYPLIHLVLIVIRLLLHPPPKVSHGSKHLISKVHTRVALCRLLLPLPSQLLAQWLLALHDRPALPLLAQWLAQWLGHLLPHRELAMQM
jgi:hypothetical protein